MFGRVAESTPVRWVNRRVGAAMETLLGRSVLRLTGAKPRVLASAIAYNLFFATVPLVFATLAVASLVGESEEALAELEEILSVLPDDVATFIHGIVEGAAATLGDSTALAFFVSLAVALWSGSRAAITLMEALEVIEGVVDDRSYVTKRFVGLVATLGLVVALLILAAALVLGDTIVLLIEGAGHPGVANTIDLLAGPVAAAILVLFLAGFFTWAPPDPLPGRWTATLLSTGGIALASWGFGWVTSFSLFGGSATLAVLGSVALVLIWLYVISYVLIAVAAFSVTVAGDEEAPLWKE